LAEAVDGLDVAAAVAGRDAAREEAVVEDVLATPAAAAFVHISRRSSLAASRSILCSSSSPMRMRRFSGPKLRPGRLGGMPSVRPLLPLGVDGTAPQHPPTADTVTVEYMWHLLKSVVAQELLMEVAG
jgi:hypothetical protein